MFIFLKVFLSKNKCTLIGTLILALFSLSIFFSSLINGNEIFMESFGKHKNILALFRLSLYMGLFFILNKNKDIPKRSYLIKITTAVIIIYELIFIVDIPFLFIKD